jgi:hypothetical protein
MDLCDYKVLFQCNQGMNPALKSLSIVQKLEPGSPEGVSKIRTNLSELHSYANNHFASNITQKEQEEEGNFYRVRRNREKAEDGPNKIYFELRSRREARREQRLPSRAVILPWTQADDDRILATQNAVSSSLPTQPELPRSTGASEQKNQRGGTPT